MQNIDLLKSGIMLRSLFDHSGDAIFIYDLQGEILDVNRSACKRLGYS
ncbi:MAG TPA: PAS domain S-box protein, partial [Archaeoglobaceae archaeon]|nr:PAS domain S-box protein [Archaeoglobaceae archaeon]